MHSRSITRVAAVILGVGLLAATPREGFAIDAKDRTVVPGIRVGAISKLSTRAQLARVYGAGNIQATKVPVGEGETVAGLILFKGRKAELLIRFKRGTRRVEWVVIEKKGAPWRTRSGIRIGSSAARLAKANGGRFRLHGFGWDYAGRSADWNRGRISKYLTVDLAPTRKLSARDRRQVLGDGRFWSNHPVMRRSRLTVWRMLVEIN